MRCWSRSRCSSSASGSSPWRAVADAAFGRVLRLLARTLALLAVLYLWFEGFWGLNYDRVPVNDKVIVRRSAVDTQHVDAYADHVLEMLDANVVAAHRNPPGDDAVRAAYCSRRSRRRSRGSATNTPSDSRR